MVRVSRKEPLGFGDRIDKLGNYFVYQNVLIKYGISFEKFLKLVDTGKWEEFLKERMAS